MPSGARANDQYQYKLSMTDQIEELRKKRELLGKNRSNSRKCKNNISFSFLLFPFSAGSQEAYIEQVDLQTDKNKRKILQLQKENKDKRQKLKELLEVRTNSFSFSISSLLFFV